VEDEELSDSSPLDSLVLSEKLDSEDEDSLSLSEEEDALFFLLIRSC
jgi:hypothetical protein